VPRHVARLVARLVIDYFASRRLVVDYFAHAARPGASARRTARRRLLRLAQARRRLLRPRRAFGCLGTSRGSSSTISPTPRVWVPRHLTRLVPRLVVDYFALRRLVVDYFTYAARPGALARRAARRRLLRLRCASACLGSPSTTSPRAARHRLLHLCCAIRCLCSSRGSSSTTSPMLCDRVLQHVARFVVDHAPPHVSTTRCLAAPALLCLRRAPGRAVSLLDFSSVGCTGSRSVPSHSVSRLDYSVCGRP
jgi:hypothetical protein